MTNRWNVVLVLAVNALFCREAWAQGQGGAEIPPSIQMIHHLYESKDYSNVDCGTTTIVTTYDFDSLAGGDWDEITYLDACSIAATGLTWTYYQIDWPDPNGSSTLFYSQSDGQWWPAGDYSPFPFYYEKCDVFDGVWLNADNYFFLDRVATTTFKLHTGGKQGVTRQNLFTLSGVVNVVNDKFCGPVCGTIPVSNYTQISIAGGPLGSDGVRHVAFYDNTVQDITPSYGGNPYYLFYASYTKHK